MTGPAMFNDAPVRTEVMLALFRTVQRRLLLLTAATAVLGAGVGALVAGVPGVWGALLAAALGLAFTLTTVALLRFVAGRGPEILQLVLIGGWIVKMVLVVLVMLWLRELDFYHRGVFFGTLVVVVLGAVVVEIGTVATSRIPYVDTPMPTTAEDVSSLTGEGDGGMPGRDRVADPHDAAPDGPLDAADGERDGDRASDPAGPEQAR